MDAPLSELRGVALVGGEGCVFAGDLRFVGEKFHHG
jgi:hypothetical protein